MIVLSVQVALVVVLVEAMVLELGVVVLVAVLFSSAGGTTSIIISSSSGDGSSTNNDSDISTSISICLTDL